MCWLEFVMMSHNASSAWHLPLGVCCRLDVDTDHALVTSRVRVVE